MSKSRPKARRLDTMGVWFTWTSHPKVHLYRTKTPGGRAVQLSVSWSRSGNPDRYLPLSSGHVIRNPYTRPLLHNGRKAKR